MAHTLWLTFLSLVCAEITKLFTKDGFLPAQSPGQVNKSPKALEDIPALSLPASYLLGSVTENTSGSTGAV